MWTVQRSPLRLKDVWSEKWRRQAIQLRRHPRRLTSVSRGGRRRRNARARRTIGPPRDGRSLIRLSILIATLESRRPSFERLARKLERQSGAQDAAGQVEILSDSDDGREPIGRKRNRLLQRALGEFVVFVDDDDDVHDDYVGLILTAIGADPELDSIGIEGRITFRGRRSERFVMSNRFREYAWTGDCYVRPPHHINPIRREIARRYRFEEVDRHEDSDWAMRICRDGVLRRERMIDAVLYRYASRRSWTYQRLLDHTEFVRHPLGLKVSNRHRIKRRLSRL